MTLVLLMVFAAAFAEGTDYVGVWYLNKVVQDGIEMSPAGLMISATITLNEDGTGKLVLEEMGEADESDATWTADGNSVIVNDGSTDQLLTLQDGNLVGEEEGVAMVFGRENAPMELFSAGEVRTDVQLEDFNGTWNITLIDMMGAQVPYVMVNGSSTVLTIENGAVYCVETPDPEYSMDPEAVVKEYEMTGTFTDNSLVVSADIDKYVDAPFYVLSLHESGCLSHEDSMGEGMEYTIYFEKSAE